MRYDRSTAHNLALLAMASLALGGCASMDRDECVTADWRTIGYEDGVAGYSGGQIGEYREACAEHGVAPDLDSYQEGRNQGLREYCQPANGFRIGARGVAYSGICPIELDGPFAAAYDSGRRLHTLQSRVSSTSSQLDNKRRELNRTEENIVRASATIVRSESTADERAQALLDTKQSAEKVGRLKAEIKQLEADKVLFERELEDYRATIAYAY